MASPVLKDIRGTKTITLPGYPDSEVVLYDSILVGDALRVEKLATHQSPEELIKALPIFIKSWNFVDETQKPLAIDEKSVGLLSVEAVTTIAQEVSALVDAKKKPTIA